MDEKKILTTINETYVLPSLGKFDNIPDGKVTLRMMTTKEEKLRLGSKDNFYKTIATIIGRCIIDPEMNLDVSQMCQQDFVFLMYKLRELSYGSDYNMTVKCPECGHVFSTVVDLSKVEVKPLSSTFTNTFKIGPLPVSGDIVTCKFLKLNDTLDIIDEADEILRKYPEYEGDPTLEVTLCKEILEVNGKKLPDHKLKEYVDNMYARDLNYIDHKYNQITDFGMDTELECTCKKCGKKFKFDLSYGPEFFRPSVD